MKNDFLPGRPFVETLNAGTAFPPKISDRTRQKERFNDSPPAKAAGTRDKGRDGYSNKYKKLRVNKELVMKLFCHSSFQKS
jgi:hypothetical protein